MDTMLDAVSLITTQFAVVIQDISAIHLFNVIETKVSLPRLISYYLTEIMAYFIVIIAPIIIYDENCNPCIPSPCGPNSLCHVLDTRPVCSCLPNYIGRPPTCRPECMVNSDCPSNQACINEKCRNPCVGTCGLNTECHVLAHTPRCICSSGYEGDPFSGCYRIVQCKPIPGSVCPTHINTKIISKIGFV